MEEKDFSQKMKERDERRKIFDPIIKKYLTDNSGIEARFLSDTDHFEAIQKLAQGASSVYTIDQSDVRDYEIRDEANA